MHPFSGSYWRMYANKIRELTTKKEDTGFKKQDPTKEKKEGNPRYDGGERILGCQRGGV